MTDDTGKIDKRVLENVFYGPDLAAEIHARAAGYKLQAGAVLVTDAETSARRAYLQGGEDALRAYAVEIERRTPHGDVIREKEAPENA